MVFKSLWFSLIHKHDSPSARVGSTKAAIFYIGAFGILCEAIKVSQILQLY